MGMHVQRQTWRAEHVHRAEYAYQLKRAVLIQAVHRDHVHRGSMCTGQHCLLDSLSMHSGLNIH